MTVLNIAEKIGDIVCSMITTGTGLLPSSMWLGISAANHAPSSNLKGSVLFLELLNDKSLNGTPVYSSRRKVSRDEFSSCNEAILITDASIGHLNMRDKR